jgi:hypothetical protein
VKLSSYPSRFGGGLVHVVFKHIQCQFLYLLYPPRIDRAPRLLSRLVPCSRARFLARFILENQYILSALLDLPEPSWSCVLQVKASRVQEKFITRTY